MKNIVQFILRPASVFAVTIFILSGFLVLSSGPVNVVASQMGDSEILAQGNTNKQTNTAKTKPSTNSNNTINNNLPVKGSANLPNDNQPTDEGGFVPCGNNVNDPCNISHLFRAFVAIINYLIAMSGFVAILFIVYTGVTMVYSQGQEAAVKEAKGRLTGAVIGLVLVAIAFIVINTLMASGSLGLGLENGAQIFTDPKSYIQGP